MAVALRVTSGAVTGEVEGVRRAWRMRPHALRGWALLPAAGIVSAGSVAASWISALGSGSLYSLFDSYTSDPLMYLIGPLVAIARVAGPRLAGPA